MARARKTRFCDFGLFNRHPKTDNMEKQQQKVSKKVFFDFSFHALTL